VSVVIVPSETAVVCQVAAASGHTEDERARADPELSEVALTDGGRRAVSMARSDEDRRTEDQANEGRDEADPPHGRM
jgi:hypothetical protein